MQREPATSPSGSAEWSIWQEGAFPAFALPDAVRADTYYLLPQVPQLARDGSGRPILSLALVLSGRPAPDDDNIFDLIQSGILTCDLTLALPDGVLRDGLLPLYAREATFLLTKEPQGEVEEPSTTDAAANPVAEPEPMGTASGSGAGARVGLAARLDRAAAQGVLLALQGAASGLVLGCRVRYRTAESRRVLHIFGRLATAYDDLRSKIVPAGTTVDEGTLQQLLLGTVERGALKAWHVEPSGLESPLTAGDGAALLSAFLKVCGSMLQPVPTLVEEPGLYRLGARPDAATSLDLRLAVTSSDEQTKALDAPLEAVLGGTLAGLDADNFVHLTYADPDGLNGPVDLPRRMRSGPPSRDRGAAGPTRLAAVDGSLVSISRALNVNSTLKPATSVLLASDVMHPHAGHTFAIDDLAIDHGLIGGGGWNGGGSEPLPHLPVVADPSAPLWSDRADPAQRWYPPEFTLVAPDPAADPDNSSFQFTFRESGHDSQGRVTLEGEALFTLRAGMSAATQAALAAAGNPPAQPVPALGLSVTLSLPVRDDGGALRQVDLRAEVTQTGDTVIARVALMNDYLRVAYGDLSVVGFQARPPQLALAYTYLAQVPVHQWPISLHYENKLALTPVARNGAEVAGLQGRAFVDATALAFRSPAADMYFRPEALAQEEAPSTLRAPASVEPMQPIMDRRVAIAHTSILTPIVRPEVEHVDLLRRITYATQTLGNTVALDVVFPCRTLGAFYRQDLGDQKVSIGCQSSLSLGQTELKLFEPVDDPAMNGPLYRVYRSLSQPGRFLVVPADYRITRYAASEGDRAFRPAVYLYSSLDAQNAANNRCVVMATLQPALPPWIRRDLDARLARMHHSPVLDYVTEVASEVNYTWSLSDGAISIQPAAAKLWDGFQVSVTTDLPGGLQLQAILAHSGLAAQASFRLTDGTMVNTALLLDLGDLTGPWDSGPLVTSVQGSNATLTNRIERGINVSDLAAYAADGTLQTVPVDRTLGRDQALTVALPFAAAEAYPIFTLQPGDPATLTEISSFVEDIHTNVVFVNLINFSNHNLAHLDLRARLKEAPGSETPVPISEEQAVGEADFTLPLTTYLGPRTLQFQATRIDRGGAAAASPWLEWDLVSRGNVVSLTWDLVS